MAGVAKSRGIDWIWALGLVLVVVLFIPIRRYAFSVDLPFELEPYRAVVALVMSVWLLSLLAQDDVRLLRSGIDTPLLLFSFALVGSLAANPARLSEYQSAAIKAVTLTLSLLLVFYLFVSVLRTRESVETVLRVLVGGAAVVAILALIESRTAWSPFNELDRVVPFLEPVGGDDLMGRGATYRATGSAEHPIALGAMFAILAPPALYLALRHGRLWWATPIVLVMGSLATVSRTAVVMVAIASIAVLAQRFKEALRFAPLILPIVVLVHFAVPGALGSIRDAFNPSGGLIAEQKFDGTENGSGRIADLGPSLEEFSQRPLLGYGYGTRQVTGDRINGRILDNQWLSGLLDFGLVGTVGLVLLFGGFIRRIGAIARRTHTPDGWLLVALTASAWSFAVGMFTFDAFAFTQVTVVMFVLFAVGSVLALCPHPLLATQPATLDLPRTGTTVRSRRSSSPTPVS